MSVIVWVIALLVTFLLTDVDGSNWSVGRTKRSIR